MVRFHVFFSFLNCERAELLLDVASNRNFNTNINLYKIIFSSLLKPHALYALNLIVHNKNLKDEQKWFCVINTKPAIPTRLFIPVAILVNLLIEFLNTVSILTNQIPLCTVPDFIIRFIYLL